MIRLLIGLSVVQLIAVGLLAMKVGDLQSRFNPTEAASVEGAPQASAPPSYVAATSSAPDAAEIRRIIREELAAAPAAATAGAAGPAGASVIAPPAAAARPNPALSGAVRADVQSYLSRGRISPKEMAALQMKMADLPPAERSQILRELTKAMNDGRLAGEF